jgi:threonyl-tRNA synthetase
MGILPLHQKAFSGRIQVSNNEYLSHKRHSLAHILLMAVKHHYPHALPTIGPVIENGFYYDLDFSGGEKPGNEDLAKIEKTMEEVISKDLAFRHEEVTADQARELFALNPYKKELINDLEKEGKTITLYYTGDDFFDLCAGGHTKTTSEIEKESFKLDKVAGAYWRGNEKNPMLTRIYGIAFDTKEELEAYVTQQEEAKKRDHRKLGKELDLFAFSDLVGSGMPLFTPRGTIIRSEIVNYSRELNKELGFGEVHTPNINKAELFKISGHYDQYKEDMLSVRSQYVADEMFLKPMNCPQHTQIYASKPRSYRDLPIRYSDFAVLYRDERPGELSGLTRLRAFAQDDGHIFCREDQIEEEVSNILAAIQKALTVYNVNYWMRLSLRDQSNKEKYIGEDVTWEKSQEIMRKLLIEKGIAYKEAEGEAAFYGPKIDIMAIDALGRQWQISTVQLDFVQPTRFKLEYTAQDGTKKIPVMIHRALIGSPDRFLGILIEHYGGNFPLWLSPSQITILPIADAHADYAHGITVQLQASGIRADTDSSKEGLGKKIRNVREMKTPYWAVIGDTEVANGTITLEHRTEGKIGEMAVHDLVARLTEEIRNKK